MKPYLLIAGYQYYPDRGTGDWIGCYATEEAAEKRWNELIQSYDYNWYYIVDLREWMDDET
jgi:hypothetical protein